MALLAKLVLDFKIQNFADLFFLLAFILWVLKSNYFDFDLAVSLLFINKHLNRHNYSVLKFYVPLLIFLLDEVVHYFKLFLTYAQSIYRFVCLALRKYQKVHELSFYFPQNP